MKLIKEEVQIKDYDWYINNSIPSKFDKWLGWDCGSVEYNSWEDEDNKEKHPEWYEDIYEEVWHFVGRQQDRKYYFMCVSAPYGHNDRIGKTLSFNTFREGTYKIVFPGRNY